LLEILGFFLLCALALCLLAEVSKDTMFGVFGGLLILFAGLWLMADSNSIEIRSGGNLGISMDGVINATWNDNGTIDGLDVYANTSSWNETTQIDLFALLNGTGTEGYTYSQITTPMPIFNNAFGIMTILMGISIIYFYAMRYYGRE
jgi:hypothetical protein